MRTGWQLAGAGPRAYERHLVSAFFAACAEHLLDLVAVGPGDRVVDVACGTGIVARRAAARVGPAGAVTGTDVNDEMVAVARQADTGGTVRWERADAVALPVADGAADVVLCQQGMQYLPDRPAALAEARRVLRPGGRLGVAVWRSTAHQPGFAALAGALERAGGPVAGDIMRTPFRGPDADVLRPLLAGAGFADTHARIGVIAVRFPSARDFLARQVAASPLVAVVGALAPDRVAAIEEEVDRALAPFVDDDGVTFPMETWLLRAQRT
jgi:SAM-dependent methyltransferase